MRRSRSATPTAPTPPPITQRTPVRRPPPPRPPTLRRRRPTPPRPRRLRRSSSGKIHRNTKTRGPLALAFCFAAILEIYERVLHRGRGSLRQRVCHLLLRHLLAPGARAQTGRPVPRPHPNRQDRHPRSPH